MLKNGLGVLKLRPDDFWNMSLQEYWLAIEGFNEYQGGEKQKDVPMLRDELEEMMERYPD